MSIALLASLGGGSGSLTVPQLLPIGTLVVISADRGFSPTITDSRGNLYNLAGGKAAVLTTALQPGDTITVPSGGTYCVAAGLAFSGVDPVTPVDMAFQGSNSFANAGYVSTGPGPGPRAVAGELQVGFLGADHPSAQSGGGGAGFTGGPSASGTGGVNGFIFAALEWCLRGAPQSPGQFAEAADGTFSPSTGIGYVSTAFFRPLIVASSGGAGGVGSGGGEDLQTPAGVSTGDCTDTGAGVSAPITGCV